MSYKYKLLFEYYYKIKLKGRVLAPYYVIFMRRKKLPTYNKAMIINFGCSHSNSLN